MMRTVSLIFLILFGLAFSIFSVEHPKTLFERMEMVLRYGHSQQVRDSLNRVSELNEDEQKQLIPNLQNLLKLEDYLIQKKIAEVIGSVTWKDLDNELLPLLDSKYDMVFYTATSSIEKKDVQEANPIIEKMLQEAEYLKEDNRLLALIRLAGTLKNNDLVAFFSNQMQDKKNHVSFRREMLRYMGDVQTQQADVLGFLEKTAMDKNEAITLRAHAVYALNKIDGTSSQENFRTILTEIDAIEDVREKRKYASLRSQIITALAQSGDKNIVTILIKMAKDDDASVRLRAVRELGKLKNNKAVELIRYKAYYDPDLTVQKEARKILKNWKELEEENSQDQNPNSTLE